MEEDVLVVVTEEDVLVVVVEEVGGSGGDLGHSHEHNIIVQ